MSKLWVQINAHKKDIFIKLCAEMQLRFQWHAENFLQELGFGLGVFLISPSQRNQDWGDPNVTYADELTHICNILP